MRNVCLTICRFSLAAWVGGAILFVITSVHEQMFDGFESATKDQLALIRFPDYYLFGSILLTTVFLSGLVGFKGKRRIVLSVLALASLALMAVDYSMVYQPLVDAITPPGQVRTEQFTTLHTQSKQINQAGLSLALIAALIVCWPVKTDGPSLDH